MIRYDEPLIRPPSEADSLILQASLGCSHNGCAFCFTYRSKSFRPRPLHELLAEIDWAGENLPDTNKVFLADGDALCLPTQTLLAVLSAISTSLPGVRRVSSYAAPGNLLEKSLTELEELRSAGLSLLYLGLETGHDDVLKAINKGVTAEQILEGCDKAHRAGMKLFLTIVLGLAPPHLAMENARATAKLLDGISPRFAGALSLMHPDDGQRYASRIGDATFRPSTPQELLQECRELVAHINAGGMMFYTNHASNYLPLAGTLQKDKAKLLRALDEAIANPEQRRPEWMRGL
jgi:hypothetical protein